VTIFNVPVGEDNYDQAKLRDKARQLKETIEACVKDMGDEYPRELWTML